MDETESSLRLEEDGAGGGFLANDVADSMFVLRDKAGFGAAGVMIGKLDGVGGGAMEEERENASVTAAATTADFWSGGAGTATNGLSGSSSSGSASGRSMTPVSVVGRTVSRYSYHFLLIRRPRKTQRQCI